jgi:hypothetical protein
MQKFVLLAFMVLLAASGCVSSTDEQGRLRHKQFEVEPSGLDWIEIAYYPAQNDPLVKFPCRLSLFGAGEVEFKTGRSPRLWSSFSDKVNDPYWNDLYSDRMHLPKEEMQSVFQAFVDEGIAPRDEFTRKTEAVKRPYVNISAQIGREKIRLATDNKYLVDLVEEAMENFTHVLNQAAAATGEYGVL